MFDWFPVFGANVRVFAAGFAVGVIVTVLFVF
jgi:hypothetical protein